MHIFLKEKYQLLTARYNKLKEILIAHPEYKQYFEALPFNSGYFMCVELKGLDAEKVRQLLLQQYSIGLIAFNSSLRIAFSATPLTSLETLFDRLYKACKDIAQSV